MNPLPTLSRIHSFPLHELTIIVHRSCPKPAREMSNRTKAALLKLKKRRQRVEETQERSRDDQQVVVGEVERDDSEAFVKRTKISIVWECTVCKRVCIPIRDESRCICGHRLKHHAPLEEGKAPACMEKNCSCKAFFYIVAEGSWILRCRYVCVFHAPHGDRVQLAKQRR